MTVVDSGSTIGVMIRSASCIGVGSGWWTSTCTGLGSADGAGLGPGAAPGAAGGVSRRRITRFILLAAKPWTMSTFSRIVLAYFGTSCANSASLGADYAAERYDNAEGKHDGDQYGQDTTEVDASQQVDDWRQQEGQQHGQRDGNQDGAAEVEAGDDDDRDSEGQQPAQAGRFRRRDHSWPPFDRRSIFRHAFRLIHSGLLMHHSAISSDHIVNSLGFRRSRARRPADKSVALMMASRKPPGGMEWCAGSRS